MTHTPEHHPWTQGGRGVNYHGRAKLREKCKGKEYNWFECNKNNRLANDEKKKKLSVSRV